jgi:hypothetical protein
LFGARHPRLKEALYGPPAPREATSWERNSQHLAEEIRKFTAQGMTRAEAITRATAEEPAAMWVRRLNLPVTSWSAASEATRDEGVRHFSLMTGMRPKENSVRRYSGPAANTTAHVEDRQTPRALVPWQVAAGQRDGTGVLHWVSANFPAPPPGSDEAALEAHSQLVERTVEAILAEARAILADPRERARMDTVLRERRFAADAPQIIDRGHEFCVKANGRIMQCFRSRREAEGYITSMEVLKKPVDEGKAFRHRAAPEPLFLKFAENSFAGPFRSRQEAEAWHREYAAKQQAGLKRYEAGGGR